MTPTPEKFCSTDGWHDKIHDAQRCRTGCVSTDTYFAIKVDRLVDETSSSSFFKLGRERFGP